MTFCEEKQCGEQYRGIEDTLMPHKNKHTHKRACAHMQKHTLQNTYSNGAVDRKFDLNH